MNDNFTRIPGHGFMFYRFSKPDARTKAEQKVGAAGGSVPLIGVWRGWLALPGGVELQVRALSSTRSHKYAVTLHAFPKDGDEKDESAWKQVASFELPGFGQYSYVDSEVKIGSRTFKIRAIRVVNPDTDDLHIRLRLPQVMNIAEAKAAMV